MATIAWTDEEFASVASALRYPSARDNVIVPGFPFDLLHQAWLLDRVLQELSPASKPGIVALAGRIAQAELDKWDSAGLAPDVSRVGDISRDVAKGLATRESAISEMRQRLSETIPFALCQTQGMSSGGIQGSWCE